MWGSGNSFETAFWSIDVFFCFPSPLLAFLIFFF
jgi:hypothetical protein